MTIPTRFWLFLALTISAVVSWNILDISTSKRDKKAPSSRQIDFYAKNINTLQTNAQGQPQNRLIAKVATHFEKDDHTELEQPIATLYDTNSPPWVIKAERGLVTAEGKRITLQRNVSIYREPTKTAPEILITTESLLIKPDKNYAETSDPIRFRSGDNVINSIGMNGYIGRPMKIELLSNVRGEYEAP